MSKVFNLLLGSGFSKSLAGLKTGMEISEDFFANFKESSLPLYRQLIDSTKQFNYSWGTTDSELFQIQSISDFFGSIITKKRIEALKQIKDSGFDDEINNHLTNLIEDRFKTDFSYESIAFILNSFIYSCDHLLIDQDHDLLQQAHDFKNEIIQEVYNLSSTDIHYKPTCKERLIIFFKYLIHEGYQINIYDLNHDEVVEDIIKSDPCLQKHYQDFFDDSDIEKPYYNKERPSRSFNKKAQKKKLNHFKIHGSLRITLESPNNWIKLNSLEEYEFYKQSRNIRGLLYADYSKAADIFKHIYHSFCFIDLSLNMRPSNPLMIVGYGFGDSHLNALLEGIYSIKTDNLRHNGDKVTLFCNETIEDIFKKALYLHPSGIESVTGEIVSVRHSTLFFESGFLNQFNHAIENYANAF